MVAALRREEKTRVLNFFFLGTKIFVVDLCFGRIQEFKL